MIKYLISFWYTFGGKPDLVVEAVSEGTTKWSSDQAFKEVMGMYQVPYVEYALLVLYNEEFPGGITARRWGLRLENTAYAYGF